MLALVTIEHTGDIAPHVPAHRDYLDALMREGTLVTAGQFTPHDGGAFVLRVRDDAAAHRILATEPYLVAGVARHHVHAWAPNRGELVASLAGKVALVTGASSGIGEATALALATRGAAVALVARRADRLEKLRARIEDLGGTAAVIAADLAQEADALAVADRAVAALGGLDIVVNNAGIMLLAPVAEATASEWRRMIELNLLSLMHVTHAALPHLRARRGHLVNIASLAGRVANPNASGYAASKFGVVGFSESIRREVYADGVRVTVVEPGVVATELGDHVENAAMQANLRKRVAEVPPLQPADIASAIVHAVTQPPHVAINEIVIRPTGQER